MNFKFSTYLKKFFVSNFKNLDEYTFEVVQKTFSSSFVRIGGMVTSFVLSVFLGRTLGADGLGIISLANKITGLLLIVCMLGTKQILVKEIALGLSRDDFYHIGNMMRSAFTLNGGFALSISIVLLGLTPWLTGYVFNKPQLFWPLIIGLIVVTPQVFSRIFSAGFIGYRKIWQSNLVGQSLSVIITCLLVVGLWLAGYRITIFNTAIAYAVGRTSVTLTASAYWQVIKTKVKEVKSRSVRLFKDSYPLLISSISNVLISNADLILLGIFVEAKQVGLYAIASRVAFLTNFLLKITNSALSGNIASMYHNGKVKELQRMVQRVTLYLSLTGLIPLLIYFFAGESILSIWGSEFVNAYWILIILAIGQFVNVSTGAAGQLLIMCGFHKEQSYVTTTFMAINIVLNLILISQYGVLGAAFTTMITVSGVNLTRVIVAKIKTNVLTMPIRL